MPVKYSCPKCDRRFVDWGAEKLGFKCPDCKDQELRRIGAVVEEAAKRPTLKRRAKKADDDDTGVFSTSDYESDDTPTADIGVDTAIDGFVGDDADADDSVAVDLDADIIEAGDDSDD